MVEYSMASIKIVGNKVVVNLELVERIASLRRRITIPVSSIKSVGNVAPEFQWNEWRIPGTYMPYVIKAGTYYTPRGKEFWYRTWKKRFCVDIRLKNHKFDGVIVGFENEKERDSILKSLQQKTHE